MTFCSVFMMVLRVLVEHVFVDLCYFISGLVSCCDLVWMWLVLVIYFLPYIIVYYLWLCFRWFFINFCIFFIFSDVFSFFWLLLVLLAQVVWFIVVFCFVAIFLFYSGVIKWLIFLFAIGTVSINYFCFCNFFVILAIIFLIFLFFIIKTTKFSCKIIVLCFILMCVFIVSHKKNYAIIVA